MSIPSTSRSTATHNLHFRDDFPPTRPSDLTCSIGVQLVLRRMIPLFLPVIVTISLPPVFVILLKILDGLSRGNGVFSLVLSITMTQAFCFNITKFAPSMEKRNEALKSWTRIWSLSLLFSLLSFRHFFSLFLPSFEVSSFLSFWMGSRLAVGMLLLSILVALRFVGPIATCQCSTYPLLSNPYEKFLYSFTSGTRFLNMIVEGPSPSHKNASSNTNTSFAQNRNRNGIGATQPHHQSLKTKSEGSTIHQNYPKRYKSPPLTKTLMQLFVHALFGAVFSVSTLAPVLKSAGYNLFVEYTVTSSCAFFAATTFLANSGNHELAFGKVDQKRDATSLYSWLALENIKNRHESFPVLFSIDILQKLWAQVQASTLLLFWTIIPCASLLFQWVLSKEATSVGSNKMDFGTMFQAVTLSLVSTLFMGAYIMTSDIVQRINLLQPGLNVQRFIEKSGALDENVAVEDVIVDVILGGLGAKVLEYVIAPRMSFDRDGRMVLPHNMQKTRAMNFVGNDLESEELKRHDTLVAIVKRGIETSRICGFTSFEDDLLKLCLLEAFGGEEVGAELDSSLRLSRRHYMELSKRITPSSSNKGASIQPLLPVVRALAAYIGGIGATLSDNNHFFYIPPCTSRSIEYTVRTLSRFMILNMVETDDSGIVKKRYNRLSLMLPMVLGCIYQLRAGIFDFAAKLDTITRERQISKNVLSRIHRREDISAIISSDPLLDHLFNVCDEAASLILGSLKETDGSDYSINVRNEGCRKWLASFQL